MITVCCDDEPLSLSRLQKLLCAHPRVTLKAACSRPEEALAAIKRHCADLAVLDIQMPGRSGLDLVKAFGPLPPQIIFVTAHSKHAVEAFELAAVDYVLKPYSASRLEQALDRAYQRLQLDQERTVVDRVACKDNGRVRYLAVDQIEAVRANAKNSLILTSGVAVPHHWSIGQALQRLPAPPFEPISRSVLVNMDRVAEMHELFNGCAEMHMRSGLVLPVCRRARRALRKRLQ